MKATFETRIEDESFYPALEAIAAHLGDVEQHLFVDCSPGLVVLKETTAVLSKRTEMMPHYHSWS